MSVRRIGVFAVTFVALATTGCARYEYDLVNPPDLARHIGSEADESIRLEPLVYHFRSYDDYLVVRIENPTDEAVQLLGERSYAVGPDGQSHPMRGQAIAPGTFAKLIFPPVRPYYRAGPTIGVGFGVGVSRGYRNRGFGGVGFGGGYDPFFDEPRYYSYYDPSNPTYWDWRGETEARLTFVYQRGNETFSHPFTFHRKKM